MKTLEKVTHPDHKHEEDIVYRLLKRAEIRMGNTDRKSVQEGKVDRIAALLIEAAALIQMYREKNQ